MTIAARIAVVVPAFNEGPTVGAVVSRLLPVCTQCIVVDDGSTDDTADAAAAAGATVLRHLINRGQGAAMQTGMRYALLDRPDAVVTFDADDQHDALDVPALVAPVLSGQADLALGSRFLGRTEGMPRSRRWVLRAGIVFTRIFSGITVTDVHNGLRAFAPEAAGKLCITLDGMAHASEILDQIRTHRWRFVEVPVTIRYTAYSLGKGQGVLNSLRIAAELMLQRLGR